MSLLTHTRSQPMREFEVGELRALAATHPSPQLAEKLRHVAPFADHVRVVVQLCDVFPDGVPPEYSQPAAGDAPAVDASQEGNAAPEFDPAADEDGSQIPY